MTDCRTGQLGTINQRDLPIVGPGPDRTFCTAVAPEVVFTRKSEGPQRPSGRISLPCLASAVRSKAKTSTLSPAVISKRLPAMTGAQLGSPLSWTSHSL